jgi:hypothetical protein
VRPFFFEKSFFEFTEHKNKGTQKIKKQTMQGHHGVNQGTSQGPQRFRLAFNCVSEIPACLHREAPGLLAHFNLRLGDEAGEVIEGVLSALSSVLETDKPSLNPYAVRSSLFNLSSYFLKAMATLQNNLLRAEPLPEADVKASSDWGPMLALNAGSDYPPLRNLFITELFYLSRLSKLTCEGGLKELCAQGAAIASRLAETHAEVHARLCTGERPVHICGARDVRLRTFGEVVQWVLLPLRTFLQAHFAETLQTATTRLMLEWAAPEPDSYSKANFMLFLWSFVEEMLLPHVVNDEARFLLVYSVVERFDLTFTH